MRFRYRARTKEGELQTGFVEAGSRDSAANILASHELFVLSVVPVEKMRWYDRIGSYFGRVGRKEMMILSRQLAILLEARLPLNEALKMLARQVSNSTLREAVKRVSEDIDAGLSFSQALERQETVFSEFFISMIRSAEVTGNIEEVASFLADYYEKEYTLVKKARSAMTYPIVVILLFIVVATVVLTYVMPQLQPIFQESNVELPLLTKILLHSGDFLAQWWLVLVIVAAGIIGGLLSYAKTEEGRAIVDDLKVKLPILKKIYVPLAVARFANAAAVLIRGGVPVAQALEVVSHTINNVLYEELLQEASEAVRQGDPLSQALARRPDYFPELVPQMLSVAEATGQMEQVFMRIAKLYNREADDRINNMVDLIQPLLIVGIAVLVGMLFAAILIPIYKVTTSITA